MRKGRHTALTWYAGVVAFSAFAGAIGLATGAIDTAGAIHHRLPFHSPVFGAVALALVAGAPNAAVAWDAWHADRRLGPAMTAAGVLLIGWIVIEVAIIRELSWLQPFYIGVGASLLAIAGRSNRTSAPDNGPLERNQPG